MYLPCAVTVTVGTWMLINSRGYRLYLFSGIKRAKCCKVCENEIYRGGIML